MGRYFRASTGQQIGRGRSREPPGTFGLEIVIASLRHPRRRPLFFVKIDRLLVSELLSNRESAALADTLIAVAHTLDLRCWVKG